MNLIFEGLKRRKEAAAHDAQKAQGLDISLIEATYPEVLAKDDSVKVDCQPTPPPVDRQREKYRHLFGKPVESPMPQAKKLQPLEESSSSADKPKSGDREMLLSSSKEKISGQAEKYEAKPSPIISESRKIFGSTSEISDSIDNFAKNEPKIPFGNEGESSHSTRLKQLKKQIQRPIAFQEKQPSLPKFSLLSFVSSSISVCESVIFAPFKLLRFLCGAPLSTLHFYSNSAVSFLQNAIAFIGRGFSAMFRSCIDAAHYIFAAVANIPLFFAHLGEGILAGLQSFVQVCCDGAVAVKNKINGGLLSILDIYRNAWKKLVSIYLPNRWIQTATAALIRGLAIAMSCCVVFLVADALFFSNDRSNNGQITLGQATPHRKLKHFFRDPLILQQRKITETLLSMHVDTVQRDENGNGKIVIDDQSYGLGTQVMEHPRIWLEKVGRNSLYFSDKYGQTYKRAIQDMLE